MAWFEIAQILIATTVTNDYDTGLRENILNSTGFAHQSSLNKSG